MRKPRIALDPQAYKALRVWAALEDKDPGDMAGKVILDHMPAKVREAIGDIAPKPSSPPSEMDTSCKPEGEVIVCEVKKSKQLAKNKVAVDQIKDLWTNTDLPVTEIARKVGGKRQTVDSIIKRLIVKGELTERPE